MARHTARVAQPDTASPPRDATAADVQPAAEARPGGGEPHESREFRRWVKRRWPRRPAPE